MVRAFSNDFYQHQYLIGRNQKVSFRANPTLGKERRDVVDLTDTKIDELCREISSPMPETATTVERIKEVDRLALKLFTTCRNKESLLRVLQKLGVDVRESDTIPWVEKYLDAICATASLQFPKSVIYPGQQIQDFPVTLTGIPPEYDSYNEMIERKKQLGILIYKNVPLGVLMHEIYHLLQFKKGLTFFTDNQETDHKAGEALTRLEIPLRNSIWQQIKARYQGSLAYTRFQKGAFKENSTGIGQSVRKLLSREMENHQFFKRYQREFNLGTHFSILNNTNLSIYRIVIPFTYCWDQNDSKQPSV